jgi:hypothetical protein
MQAADLTPRSNENFLRNLLAGFHVPHNGQRN